MSRHSTRPHVNMAVPALYSRRASGAKRVESKH